VHGDHMGVPVTYTDAAGTAIAAPSGYSVPGFPGQSQTFADLYYNRYRDYDTTTGRYIQADPIGLAGGPSPYSYAMNNPLRYSDPKGLSAFAAVPELVALCFTPVGLLVCGTAALATWYYWDCITTMLVDPSSAPPMLSSGPRENTVVPFRRPTENVSVPGLGPPNGEDICPKRAAGLERAKADLAMQAARGAIDPVEMKRYRRGARALNASIELHNSVCPLNQVTLIPFVGVTPFGEKD
jgi:RHS repeat-associated protein